MKGALFTVLIAFIFVALLLPAVGISYDNAGQEQVIEGEQLTLDATENVSVEYADGAAESGDVVVVHDDTELEQGTDYEWHSGEVETLDDNLDSEVVEIEYPAQQRSEETQNIGNILSVFDGWYGAAIVLFASLGAALAAAAWGDL